MNARMTWMAVAAAAVLAGACGGPAVEDDADVLDVWDDTDYDLDAGKADSSTTKININTATAAKLQTLPRVTGTLAARIVAGRPFFAAKDIQRVAGMTSTIYNGIKTKITVGPSCGGTRNTACTAAGTQCRRRTSASASSGVCVAGTTTQPAAQVTVLAAGAYSYYGHDTTLTLATTLYWGYTTLTKADFNRVQDKNSVSWWTDPDRRTPGNFTASIEYEHPYNAGPYMMYTKEIKVPRRGAGVVYRVSFTCREYGQDRPCGESDVMYAE